MAASCTAALRSQAWISMQTPSLRSHTARSGESGREGALRLTLNSSLKSLPSSAERIRYSSSRESSGMGKYLLDGEGDLGSRTTVCSPAFRGIYDGQTANTSPEEDITSSRSTCKNKAAGRRDFLLCAARTTGMISWVINMLLHESVSTQNLALLFLSGLPSFIFLFFKIVSLYESPCATKVESPLKLWASCRDTFQVYKNREFTIKIKIGVDIKIKKADLRHFRWPLHKSTLFFHEAIWNLLIHGGNQRFPVVFEPCRGGQGRRRESKEKTKGRYLIYRTEAVKHIKKANSKYQNQYQPSERGKAAPLHAAVSTPSQWLTVAWPDLAVFLRVPSGGAAVCP